eukprot:6195638-Pleurochrysis_carterae.AAC.6
MRLARGGIALNYLSFATTFYLRSMRANVECGAPNEKRAYGRFFALLQGAGKYERTYMHLQFHSVVLDYLIMIPMTQQCRAFLYVEHSRAVEICMLYMPQRTSMSTRDTWNSIERAGDGITFRIYSQFLLPFAPFLDFLHAQS